ncbi:MAG: hypothetical protein ACRDN0_04045 [Trebonia sp.]
MRHHPARALPASVLVLAVIAVGGCTSAAATAGTAPVSSAAASAGSSAGAASAGSSGTATARASAPVYGPPGPDPECAAALKAERALQSRQGKDQDSETALDKDFTNFASALNSAAQHETRAATAKAMSDLASDYTDLVESQSGAAQLPDMSTVQKDGTAFDKACS